jgi:hypothetical protein
MALEILSGDDPTNVIDGYEQLCDLLVATGNDAEAIGLLHTCSISVAKSYENYDGEDFQKEEQEPDAVDRTSEGNHQVQETEQEPIMENDTGDAKEEDEVSNSKTEQWYDNDSMLTLKYQYSFPFNCGSCDMPFDVDGLFLCRYCFDLAFCRDCWTMMKEGTVSSNICVSNHDWLHITKPKRLPAEGMLLLDDVEIGFDEFKQRLRDEWKI